MNSYKPDFYIRLELDSSATVKDVKRAYAKRLKSIDQATQADEFLLLREDYELALGYVKNNLESDDFDQFELENITNNSEQTHNSNEQSATLKSDQEDEAIEAPISPVLNLNSVPDLNNSSNTELDIQQEFELKIQRKRKFYQEAEPVVIPYDLMNELVQEIKRNHTNETSINDHEVLGLLKQYLAKDEFLNLEVKEYFEDFLAQQLVKLEFGIFNLPVLKIFANHFNWYDARYQSGRGKALAHVNYIAHQIDKSSPAFLHALNRILQIPNKEQSATILKFYKELSIHNDDIINFCVPAEHMQKWMIAKKSQLFIFNWFEYLQDQWNKINDRYKGVIFGLVSLLAVFFVTYVLTGIKQSPDLHDKFLNETYSKCDAIYANAIDKKWQGLSLLQASQLYECAIHFAPKICESRDQLEKVLEAARVLYPLKSSNEPTQTTVNLNDVYLNSNGLHYAFDPNIDCVSVNRFVTQMRWDQSPDENALAKMIPVYQACYEKAMKIISISKGNTKPPSIQSDYFEKLNNAQVFNNLASATIYHYFNNSIYAVKSTVKSSLKLTAKHILVNSTPIPVLSELELRSGLFREAGQDVLSRKGFSPIENIFAKENYWESCIPLENVKDINKQMTPKVGPAERASIQKMLESK